MGKKFIFSLLSGVQFTYTCVLYTYSNLAIFNYNYLNVQRERNNPQEHEENINNELVTNPQEHEENINNELVINPQEHEGNINNELVINPQEHEENTNNELVINPQEHGENINSELVIFFFTFFQKKLS